MKSIVIVGVGALGSQVVPLLRNIKSTIKVIDFDKVEAKNIQSQMHGKPGLGKPKVLALSGIMDLLFGLKLQTNTNRLTKENVTQLLGKPDLIVDCLDNAASRQVVQDYVRRNAIECLHGAVDANGEFGRIAWDPMFIIDQEGAAGAPTCENGEHLPFLAIVAAHLSHATKEFLTKGRRVGYQVSRGGTIQV